MSMSMTPGWTIEIQGTLHQRKNVKMSSTTLSSVWNLVVTSKM